MNSQKNDFPLHDFYKNIYSTYDLVNRVFTFGQDVNWRKKAVAECLKEDPGNVLDVCTGTGDLLITIAKKAPEDTGLYGYDFSPEMLKLAEKKAASTGIHAEFTEGDVANMPYESDSFDAIGISFGIRNLIYQNSNADKHLAEILRVLKPGGRFVVLESSKPENPVWRFFNTIYLQFILPYLGGLLSGNLKAYKYLASSSKNYFSKTEMAGILNKSGFFVQKTRSLFLGSVMLVVAVKQIDKKENS